LSNKDFLRAVRGQSTQSQGYRRAPKQEKEGAKRLGGFRTFASGSLSQKGDVTVPDVARVEYKCTGNKSFPVTPEMLDKITKAGIANNQIPFIEIEFLDNVGKTKSRMAVISAQELEILLNRMRDAETEAAALKRRR
jgi:hypothetical protein